MNNSHHRLPLPFNQARAFAEGWGFISGLIVRLEYGPVIHGEIRGDGKPVFDSDEAARSYVESRRREPYYRAVLQQAADRKEIEV